MTGLALTLIITAGSGGTLTGGAGAVAVALTAEEVVALGLALAGNVSAVKEVWDSSIALAEANSSSDGKGKINDTPSSSHSTTTESPTTGEPNSSVDIVDESGTLKTRRWFDSEGKAIRDVDYTNHGNPKTHPEVPHEHYWDWTSNPPRSK